MFAYYQSVCFTGMGDDSLLMLSEYLPPHGCKNPVEFFWLIPPEQFGLFSFKCRCIFFDRMLKCLKLLLEVLIRHYLNMDLVN